MAYYTIVSNRKGICYEGEDAEQAGNVFDYCVDRSCSGDEITFYMDGDIIDCRINPEQQRIAA